MDIIPLIPYTTTPGHNILFSVVQLRKLKLRDMKLIAQGHTACCASGHAPAL